MNRKKVITLIILAIIGIVVAPGYVSHMPNNITISDLGMTQVQSVKEKKERFFSYMRPIVKMENHRILLQRKRIIRTHGKDNSTYLRNMKLKYGLSENDSVERLLKRVDIVPLELVLAQSANESMWGQSRFAIEGNNLFGQYCYSKGCGMVPERRDFHASHEVAVFENAAESVRSYLKNINTHPAYRELRDIRKNIRDENRPITGLALAPEQV